jgi:transcriptional regulator with XRE-family HTH domain
VTQARLATLLQLKGLKIDRSGIAKIERGYRQVSDIELAAFAQALEVSGAYLLGETNEISSEKSN